MDKQTASIDLAQLIEDIDEALRDPSLNIGRLQRLLKQSRDELARRSLTSGAPADTFAINFIERRAEQYLQDHADTEPGTGAVVFQYGEAGREYHSTLVELADDIRAALKEADAAAPNACTVPPSGWRCTRAAGHEGPCAAVAVHDAAAPSAPTVRALLAPKEEKHEVR